MRGLHGIYKVSNLSLPRAPSSFLFIVCIGDFVQFYMLLMPVEIREIWAYLRMHYQLLAIL